MSAKSIVLARGITLPLEVVNQTIGVLAKRRVGKSYTARRLGEQIYHAGVQLVIVDPKGDHWGIRSSADGKGPGIPIVIIGGEHGDVPLEVGSGEVVGKLVVEERASVLLDLSLLRKHEVATFMMMFLETVYRLKAREQYRTPLFMIIEEADEIAPQKPTPNQPNVARMLGAADDIVRRGGQRGIGVALITQRSAVINKNVLTQCEMLIALRTISPQDREALEAWIEVHGTKEQRDVLMESLASLPKGDAWFWSPGWPTDEGIFKRAHVLPIETYDSGKSPEPGEKRTPPKQLADVDLAALTKQMAATIERAKADDPKLLRGEIARLTKELRSANAAIPAVPKFVADTKAVRKEQLDKAFERGRRAESKRWQPIVRMFATKTETLLQTGRDLIALGDTFQVETNKAKALEIADSIPSSVDVVMPPRGGRGGEGRNVESITIRQTPPYTLDAVTIRTRDADGAKQDGDLSQRIVDTLGSLADARIESVPVVTVAAFVGYHPRTPSFLSAIKALEADSTIAREAGQLRLVNARRRRDGVSITTRADLHNALYRQLKELPGHILRMAIDEYPNAVAIADVAQRLDYHPRTPSFLDAIKTLDNLGIVRRSSGMLTATDLLFPAELT